MASRIRILPDHVVNQIAAGEVVERPASVVKELVENALDAGARRVHISLRNGGKTEIRVADDGSGMEREDALLALDRHATSKIRQAEDLSRVSSFGFRGEALPSIAAVSRFRLETSTGRGTGTRVKATAGRVNGVDEVARQRGTTVTVRSLFQNVPARAKFLRSASAETRAASEVVLLLALSNLRVSFRLDSNGRELLDLPPAGDLRERVAAIWGDEEAEELVELDGDAGEVRVSGLIQRPDAARPSARRRYLFVNGRPFADPGLVRVADEAYRTTVAAGVRPSLFLELGIPPGRVDVNVHPAKAEVRFRERPAVEEAVRGAIRARLARLESTAPLGRAAPGERRGDAATAAGPDAVAVGGGAVPPESEGGPPPGETGTAEEVATSEEAAPAKGAQLAFFVREGPGEPGAGAEERLEALHAGPELWQLHRRYILTSTRDGLLLIDQHSAHERVLYEEIMARFAGEGGEAQRLLFPITLRLDPAEYSAVEELSSLLGRIGFEVEPFGDRTIIVRAAPRPHPYFDPESCLREMVRELTEGSPLVDSARNQHERIAKSMACKGAIKAGQPLSPAEMSELIDRLFATELPGHDVHGRPTIVRLTLDELDRRFERA